MSKPKILAIISAAKDLQFSIEEVTEGEPTEQEVQSYQLKPSQYIPEESMFLPQKPGVEDVLSTMSLLGAEERLVTFKEQLKIRY